MDTGTAERFWSKVDRSGDCWLWTKGCGSHGYGEFYVGKTQYLAHRFAYAITVGPIPGGMTIDHTCHNADPSCRGGRTCPHRKCVNPTHLRAVTDEENQRAGPNWNGSKTHCPRNHEYTPENTHINSKGQRICRACAREYDATRRPRERKTSGPT